MAVQLRTGYPKSTLGADQGENCLVRRKQMYGLLCVHFKSYHLFSVRPISRWDRSHIDVESLTQNVAALAVRVGVFQKRLSAKGEVEIRTGL